MQYIGVRCLLLIMSETLREAKIFSLEEVTTVVEKQSKLQLRIAARNIVFSAVESFVLSASYRCHSLHVMLDLD